MPVEGNGLILAPGPFVCCPLPSALANAPHLLLLSLASRGRVPITRCQLFGCATVTVTVTVTTAIPVPRLAASAPPLHLNMLLHFILEIKPGG